MPVIKPKTLPDGYALYQNYPNPFNPSTRIEYSVSGRQNVNIKVFDVLGREVQELVNAVKGPGSYAVDWNANGVASGVYYYKLQAGDFMQTKKSLLLR